MLRKENAFRAALIDVPEKMNEVIGKVESNVVEHVASLPCAVMAESYHEAMFAPLQIRTSLKEGACDRRRLRR
ncbi:hypothetical protein PPUN110474_27300 [Pseudomonas putida]|nr:hypothetical protein PPUN110474_27300 [Pseudomonas putida]